MGGHCCPTRIMMLPDETRVFVGHDYLPKDGRIRKEFAWETSMLEMMEETFPIHVGKSESLRMSFVKCETIVMLNWLSPS